MKTKNLFKGIALSGVLALSLSTTALSAPMSDTATAKQNPFWWPEQLNLTALRDHDISSDPYGANFDYIKEFKKLDLEAVKKDINVLLTTSQPWWPADYGNYGPFFIRMAWHSAGTYRTMDGRGGAGGGQQRFDPLNSWPDNVNLDKARRLLWPVKQKYGQQISWADLMVLAGTVAMENMGFKTIGFAGGRADDWEPDVVYWGSEKFLANNRKDGKLARPLAATQMGLIYVNPEGPNGNPDPMAAAQDIRETFGRMGMDDEETVALIAGGHTFGKSHGAHKPEECIGAEPAAAALEDQGLGWKNKCGKGNAEDTTGSGLEGAWTSAPAMWTHMYLTNLFSFDWEQTRSPAGAIQWKPKQAEAQELVPDAHVEGKFHAPMMFTTDLSLKTDPIYKKIAKDFLDNPEKFEQAFARAWFKLTHRDMGPRARYLGADVPASEFVWQDPLPKADYQMVTAKDVAALKAKILDSGLSVSDLVETAWASASTYRASDMRGGANGARIALEPQVNWAVNNPEQLAKVLTKLKEIQKDFNSSMFNKAKISLADIIVLAGNTAVEKAAKDAGFNLTVPFAAGRVDATQANTDVKSFALLEPKADAFRNYFGDNNMYSPAEMMVDKADLLDLTVPEMTVLIGGMRVLGTNADDSNTGVFTKSVGKLTNDFFVNLLNNDTAWKKSSEEGLYLGYDRASNKELWKASPVDLIFGSNSELRAIAEVYAYNSSKEKFVKDFVKAWTKVMQADRFDLKQ